MSLPSVWIDTNVIIRYLTADHPTMTPETALLMSQVEQGRLKLKIAAIVIAECCRVLQSPVYRFAPGDIAGVLIAFLSAEGVEAEENDTLIRALEQYAAHRVDFIDAYLAEHAKSVGPPIVATFNDKHFAKLNIAFRRPSELLPGGP